MPCQNKTYRHICYVYNYIYYICTYTYIKSDPSITVTKSECIWKKYTSKYARWSGMCNTIYHNGIYLLSFGEKQS